MPLAEQQRATFVMARLVSLNTRRRFSAASWRD
jgi:hypothetical protein